MHAPPHAVCPEPHTQTPLAQVLPEGHPVPQSPAPPDEIPAAPPEPDTPPVPPGLSPVPPDEAAQAADPADTISSAIQRLAHPAQIFIAPTFPLQPRAVHSSGCSPDRSSEATEIELGCNHVRFASEATGATNASRRIAVARYSTSHMARPPPNEWPTTSHLASRKDSGRHGVRRYVAFFFAVTDNRSELG